MNIQESLEALLKTEVDKRVALIQAAADDAVAAFKATLERIASGEGVTHQTTQVAPSVPLVRPEPADEMPAHMRPPPDGDGPVPVYQVTNTAAMNANMSVAR